MAFLAFLNSRLGVGIITALGVLAFVASVYFSGIAAEKTRQESKNNKETIRVLRDREKNDETIETMSAAARREHLRKWVRDGE